MYVKELAKITATHCDTTKAYPSLQGAWIAMHSIYKGVSGKFNE